MYKPDKKKKLFNSFHSKYCSETILTLKEIKVEHVIFSVMISRIKQKYDQPNKNVLNILNILS